MSRGTVVFLTSVWAPGYGVSVVIAEQCRILSQAGWRPLVGAIRVEPGMHPKVDVFRIPLPPFLLRRRLASLAPSLVIAATAPFPRCLAGWDVPWIQWEHGRADQPQGLLRMEVSACDRVAPSRWLADRFCPSGCVLPNGADQMGRVVPGPRPGKSVRIVAALRGGAAESRYKGNTFLSSLPGRVGRTDFVWTLLLRGQESDAPTFGESGWMVKLNPDRDAMAAIWSESDVHLAPSRIESFDLPLVEAQHLGCAGLALSGGAHDEICQQVFEGESDLADFLARLTREQVDKLRQQSFERVAPYTWERHGELLAALVEKHARAWEGPVPVVPGTRILHRLAVRAYDLGRKALR